MQECEDHIELFSPVHVTQDYCGDVTFAPNPVLNHIDFRPVRERVAFEEHEVEDDAHLRAARSAGPHARGQSADPEDAVVRRSYIGQHPIAMRSFATATPASNILLLNLVGWFMPSDPTLTLRRPVTVFDVLKLMHREYVPLPNPRELCLMWIAAWTGS